MEKSAIDTQGNEDVNVNADVTVIGVDKHNSDATAELELSEFLFPIGR